MSKQQVPVYSICSLTEAPQQPIDFMADRFDHYLDTHKDLHFPHRHDFYHLVYFTKGTGRHSIDFVHFELQAAQIYFMIPGQVHTWDFIAQPRGYIVNFSEQYIHALINNTRYLDQFSFFSGMAARQVINIPKAATGGIEQCFETIIREATAKQELGEDMLRTALIQLFILVNRQTIVVGHPQKSMYNSILLRNLHKLVELHYKEKKLTKDYAAMLYVTPNHLNALCKDATGRSAGELIRDRVILEAKRLLVNAQMSIAQIAGELNFEDNSYFSKFFKKYTGTTPEIFRKQLVISK
jgi:AraC-like DNA-binding protein